MHLNQRAETHERISLLCRSALKGPLPASAAANVERRGLSGAISELSALFTPKERLIEPLNETEREGDSRATLKKHRERKLDGMK